MKLWLARDKKSEPDSKVVYAYEAQPKLDPSGYWVAPPGHAVHAWPLPNLWGIKPGEAMEAVLGTQGVIIRE